MAEWIQVDVDSNAERAGLIDDIFARRIDGVTVRSVFSPAECEAAVEVLERHRIDPINTMFGTMLGLPLADLAPKVADPTDRTLYLDDAEVTIAMLRDAFGMDPLDRVAGAVEPMASGRRVRVPCERGRSYAGGNVRWFEPGTGGLPAHVDNEFNAYTDGSMSHVESLAEIDGHLSWFVVLEPPALGGSLSVFEELYRVHAPADANWTDQGRRDADFDQLAVRRVTPSVGDLVVFGGGWRWHRVDDVEPGSRRVTFGGFAAAGHDGASLYFWF